MKICEERETAKGLKYEDLNVGDVFTWLDSEILPGDVGLKQKSGHVWIGKWEPGRSCSSYASDRRVTRYPNACITLGDPE